MLKKLEALAERGIDGERLSALKKIARLKARLDFGGPDPSDTPNLFAGAFKPSAKAKRICTFERNEFDVANSVKWAIESATPIKCLYRDGQLLAEAAPDTAKQLAGIALHIAQSFRALLERFSAVEGVGIDDRSAFVMGLYDGMMNDARNAGQRLPSRARPAKVSKRKQKTPVSHSAELHIHPYTIAVGLGKQIRFSTSLDRMIAELDDATRKQLAEPAAPS